MKRLFWLVVGVGMGVGLAYGASQYHVLRTVEGYELIPRQETSFEDWYIDSRRFTPADWWQHKTLTQNLIQAGKQHILQQAAQQMLQNTVEQTPAGGWK